LLPLGIGLLLTRAFAGAITRTQRALAAYLIGLVASCVLMVARERAIPASLSLELWAGVIVLVSIAGFATSAGFFRWDAAARAAALEFALVLPVFAVGYVLRFGVFSDYPATDLFQATHLMKASLEFGRFDMLNPFTAGSYAPVIPTVEGLLVRYLGFDPLRAVWVLAALSTAPKFLALRAAVQPILATREERIVATAAAAVCISPFAPTNGELAMFGALALFSFLVASLDRQPASRHAAAAAVVAVAFAAGYYAARAAPAVYGAVLLVACVLPGLGLAARLVVAAPLVVALMPLHRSTLLFVPLALACAVLLSMMRAWTSRRLDAGRLLVGAAAALTVFGGIAALGLLAWVLGNAADDLRQPGPYRWIVEAILGTTLDQNPEVLLGTGPKVALFELARAMSPSFVVAAACLTAYAWSRGLAPAARDAVPAWMLAVAVGAGLLLGVPFVYRAGFFVIVLLAVAFGAAFAAAAHGARAAVLCRWAAALAAGYALIVVPLAYRCAPYLSCERAPYAQIAQPFFAVLGALAAALALAAVYGARSPAGPRLTAATLILVFALEFAVSKAYFFPHAYGTPPRDAAAAISHLSRAEMQLAASLRGLGPNAVLISDPHTMANLRALTGLNSLITFSNLDTLSPGTVGPFRSWLRAVLEGAQPAQCAPESPRAIIRGGVTSSEFNYWLARVARPELSGGEILRLFGYREAFLLTSDAEVASRSLESIDQEWQREALARAGPRGMAPHFVLVVNRKTVDWARGSEVGYYPDVRPLDPALIESLRSRCRVVVRDGRFAVVDLPP
jgi:hypothetical protein